MTHPKPKRVNSSELLPVDENMEAKAAYTSVIDSTNRPLESKKQLLQALQYSGRNPTTRQVDKVWKQYSEDGYLQYTSFMRVMREIKATTKQQLIQAFRKIDINKDGYLSHTELYGLFTSKGEKLTHAEVQKIIESVDANKDGKLDYDEFANLFIETSQKCRQLSLDNLEERRPSSPSRSISRPLSASSNGRQTPRSSRTFVTQEDLIEEDPPSTPSKEKKSKTSLFGRPGSAKKSSRPSSAKKDAGRTTSAQKDIKQTENTFSLRSESTYDKKCILSEPPLKNWGHVKSKGCFWIDENDDFIVTHQYLLDLSAASQCYITIEPYSLSRNTIGSKYNDKSDMSMVNAVDTCVLIVQEPRNAHDPPEVIGFTELKENQQFRWQGDLRSGMYRLIPFTSGCRLRKRLHEPDDSIDLVRKDQHGQIQLSRAFKETLSDFFEICDLDGNGLLSKSEFGWFQILGGDEFDDEVWNIVSENVETKKEELTREGFFQIHEMQAREEHEDSVNELNETVSSMGYNTALDMDQACPFKLNVYTKDSHARLDVAKLSTKRDQDETNTIIADYVTKHAEARSLKSINNVNFWIYKSDAGVISVGENKSSSAMFLTVDTQNSENCVCSNRGEKNKINQRSKMILDRALPKNEKNAWRYNCKIVGSNRYQTTPVPAERQKSTSSKKSQLMSIF